MRIAMAGYVRVHDARAKVAVPAIAVGGLTAANVLLAWLGVIEQGYISPYVALVAAIANKMSLRTGLVAACMAIPLINNLVFPPFGAFQAVTIPEAMSYASMIAVAFLVAPRLPRHCDVSLRREYDAGTELPFTRRDHKNGNGSQHGTGVHYWDVYASGVWAKDCEVGTEYARLFLERVKANEPHPIMAWIVRDMVVRGPALWSGIEVGFVQGLARPSAGAIRKQHKTLSAPESQPPR